MQTGAGGANQWEYFESSEKEMILGTKEHSTEKELGLLGGTVEEEAARWAGSSGLLPFVIGADCF